MTQKLFLCPANHRHTWHCLPFVGGEGDSWNFWDVPMTGGEGAQDTGLALAQILLIHLRQHSEHSSESVALVTGVFMSILNKARGSTDEEYGALLWQLNGLMLQLAPCIIGAAHHGFQAVDDLDPQELLTRANAGLNSGAADEEVQS
ncbi:hypothetical protein FQZ97_811170 [compost metagenome]